MKNNDKQKFAQQNPDIWNKFERILTRASKRLTLNPQWKENLLNEEYISSSICIEPTKQNIVELYDIAYSGNIIFSYFNRCLKRAQCEKRQS